MLEWTEAIADRGHRGGQTVGTTEIALPGWPAKDQSPSRTQQLRRCFLRGSVGDSLNVMLAGAAWNPRKCGGRFYCPCSGCSR